MPKNDDRENYDPELEASRRRAAAGRKFATLADQLVEALETTPVNWQFDEASDAESKTYKERAGEQLKGMMIEADRKEGRRFRR